MESKEQAAQRIFRERASFYTTSAVHTDPQVLTRVSELLLVDAESRVLDIATGSGHTAFAVAENARRVFAGDFTHAMLVEANKLIRERRIENVALLECDAHALPFADETFQGVTCRRAAHHFSRIDVALGEMRRTLAPDGRLVIDDRSVPEHDAGDACMNHLDVLHDESHVRQYRPSEWRTMLERHGFQVDMVETYTRHRSISALTRDVAPERVARIHEILAAIDDETRSILDVREIDGELHLTHFFVLVAATRTP